MNNTIDKVLGLAPAHVGWMYVWWIEPGKHKKTFTKAFHKMERYLKELGYKGWLTSSQKDHTIMHKLIEKYGGVQYGSNVDYLFFKKELANV